MRGRGDGEPPTAETVTKRVHREALALVTGAGEVGRLVSGEVFPYGLGAPWSIRAVTSADLLARVPGQVTSCSGSRLSEPGSVRRPSPCLRTGRWTAPPVRPGVGSKASAHRRPEPPGRQRPHLRRPPRPVRRAAKRCCRTNRPGSAGRRHRRGPGHADRCMPATVREPDSRRCAGRSATIARGLLESAIATLARAVQQAPMARLQRMETGQASAPYVALLGVHARLRQRDGSAQAGSGPVAAGIRRRGRDRGTSPYADQLAER